MKKKALHIEPRRQRQGQRLDRGLHRRLSESAKGAGDLRGSDQWAGCGRGQCGQKQSCADRMVETSHHRGNSILRREGN